MAPQPAWQHIGGEAALLLLLFHRTLQSFNKKPFAGEARSPSSRQMASGSGVEPGPVSPRAGTPRALGVSSAGTPSLSALVESSR